MLAVLFANGRMSYADVESDARAFLEEFDVTYPKGSDLGTRISRDYGMQGVPEKFLLTKKVRFKQ